MLRRKIPALIPLVPPPIHPDQLNIVAGSPLYSPSHCISDTRHELHDTLHNYHSRLRLEMICTRACIGSEAHELGGAIYLTKESKHGHAGCHKAVGSRDRTVVLRPEVYAVPVPTAGKARNRCAQQRSARLYIAHVELDNVHGRPGGPMWPGQSAAGKGAANVPACSRRALALGKIPHRPCMKRFSQIPHNRGCQAVRLQGA